MLNARLNIAWFLLIATLLLLSQAVIAESLERVVVAKVNGQPIFKDQVEKRMGNVPSKTKDPKATDSSQMKVLRERWEQALDEEILTELFYQGGQKLAIQDVDKKIAEKMDSLKASLTDAQRQKISDDAVREHAQRRVYIHEYMVFNDLIKPRVPEEDVRAYYESTKQGYARQVPAVRAQHIIVKIKKDATNEERELARKKIEQARQLLLDEKDFAEVAKEYSEDGSASGGGFLGTVEPGYMPPEFEREAFSLEVGAISKIVKTKFGFHVLEVLKKLPKGSVPEYEDLKDFFTRYLEMDLAQKKLPAHAQKIRAKANIEILLFEEQGSKS